MTEMSVKISSSSEKQRKPHITEDFSPLSTTKHLLSSVILTASIMCHKNLHSLNETPSISPTIFKRIQQPTPTPQKLIAFNSDMLTFLHSN